MSATPRELDLIPQMDQDASEFEQLLALCAELAPRVIVEIGVFYGGTLARFAERFPLARVIGIDPAPEPVALGLRRLFPNLELVLGHSQDAGTRALAVDLAGGLVDVVHIDGDHSEDACRADWAWAQTVTRRPALVAIHDVNRRDEIVQAYKVFDELEAELELETERLGASPNVYGIGVVKL